jgi:diadenylate cyclase
MTSFIRWQDIMDIAIVAFIIYRGLLLFKGTRALQLIIGLAVVFFVFYLARRLELFTLGWILNNFVASIALVVVVIFQNEIRRVLSALGRSPFFGRISYVDETLFYDELVNACVVMSKRRIGALIVIEREMALGEFLEAGIKIDADVNAELLISLFQTASPLHDGAVVVREGRIAAACCVLPLSSRDDLDKDLGTRHRAAVGLTEVTDAVSVAVSEESGQISYCFGGEITRNLTGEGLKKHLRELLAGKRARSQSTSAECEGSIGF